MAELKCKAGGWTLKAFAPVQDRRLLSDAKTPVSTLLHGKLSSQFTETFYENTAYQIMVASKALRATRCASCQMSLLRAFTSVAGPTTRLQLLAVRTPLIPVFRARYSSQVAQDAYQEVITARRVVESAEEIVEEEPKEEEEQDEEPLGVSAIPWYLQVQTPSPAPQPLSDRQRIPDLPESPPPILEPLLQQISVDLGMDSLSLLDLRNLDPPPALGANLIMIIGTARSEKHLHVSADRLCRWLRSNYKLRPDADGLLGRNELKLKLRRKNRRAKLMGSSADENSDDGVRTGWVCVDVGSVDSPGNSAEDEPAPQDFVGFGRRTDGVKLVVQMLTEEKREEIDLEKLWGGILKRGSIKEPEGIEDGIESTLQAKSTKQLENPSLLSPETRGFQAA